MLTELSEKSVQAALKHYEVLFASGDVEAILKEFTDDVEVRYASRVPFKGKDELREMLRERFAKMRDYRLTKQLEFLSPPNFASSWTGSWIDVHTDARMEVFGIELLTVREGRVSRWWASVSVSRSP